jgi:hypothetical protein
LTPNQDACGTPSETEQLPFGLALLQFGISDSDQWNRVVDHQQWHFSRHRNAEPGDAR